MVSGFAASLPVEDRIAAGLVMLFMFLSMLCWATVIRSAAHLGFQLGVLSYLAGLSNVPVSQLAAHKPPSNAPKRHAGTVSPPSVTDASATPSPNEHADAESKMECGVYASLSEDVLAIERKHEYCNQLVHRLVFYFRYACWRSFRITLCCLTSCVFSLGFRLMFISIPFMFVTIGSVELIVGTAVIIAFLYTWDFAASVHFFDKDPSLSHLHKV
jgi:hypothetical protein